MEASRTREPSLFSHLAQLIQTAEVIRPLGLAIAGGGCNVIVGIDDKGRHKLISLPAIARVITSIPLQIRERKWILHAERG